jgi:type II secretory pathway pseudopilin PulG
MEAPVRRGITFIEIMIVLVITGLIAVTTLPKLFAMFRQQSTIAAADRFVRVHELARSSALRYGRTSQLHIDATGLRFFVDVDTSGTGIRDTIGPIRSVSDLGVAMSSTDTLMCMDARGLPSRTNGLCQAPAGTVVFSNAGRYDSVTVTTLGKVLR